MADSNLRKKFDLGNSYPYWNMLRRQVAGEVDSWAIRWWLCVFLAGGLSVFPRSSLVTNIGFDGSGTHCGEDGRIGGAGEDVRVRDLPGEFADLRQFEIVRDFLSAATRRPSLLSRLARRFTK
jgi:hypothetical protein